jgi:predicted HAD superfamily Cof-like phosphohydrolase
MKKHTKPFTKEHFTLTKDYNKKSRFKQYESFEDAIVNKPKEMLASLDLWHKLLIEEVDETTCALGYLKLMLNDFQRQPRNSKKKRLAAFNNPATQEALRELVDGLCDIEVITQGIANLFKVPLDKLFYAVYVSNMSKLDDNGKPIFSDGKDGNPKGKQVKSKNYKKPNFKKLIK